MKTIYIAAVLILAVAIGAVWYTKSNSGQMMTAQEDYGSYPYICTDGVQFTMVPDMDMTTIRIEPLTGAPFAQTTLSQTSAARFEGGGMVFTGAGESVTLTEGGRVHTCDPVPSQDSAPFNFGDTGEGGGEQEPAVMLEAAQTQIIGTWRSTDDPLSVRTFKDDGSIIDTYDNTNEPMGTWRVFTGEQPGSTDYEFATGIVYLHISFSDKPEEALYFSIQQVTPETLEMTYLARGNVLRYEKIQ